MARFAETPIFDADQHMYETSALLTKYLPEKYSRACSSPKSASRPGSSSTARSPTSSPTRRSSASRRRARTRSSSPREHRGAAAARDAGTGHRGACGNRNPADRAAELDRQGVVGALNYPTLASLVEHSSADDPELTLAIIHALNPWMFEHWTYNYEDRVFSTPIINHSELFGAQRELEYLLDNGVKVALIKPGPVNGIRGWRSPALPEFDPFWRDVEAAGLPIVLHASYPPLDDYIARWEPPSTQNFMAQRAFRWMALGHREITDMITSLICHGTLTRFPKLRIASVENGSSWIFPLFHDFEDLYKKMPQNFPEHPHDVFRSQHLGEPVLGGRRGEHGRLGPGAVRVGLPAPRGPGRTAGFPALCRRHGRAAHLRLHGRQRAAVHGPTDRQSRPRRRQAAGHVERVTEEARAAILAVRHL
jgi:predicted TIM-barrel fold metal-dependent hydrolase